MTAHSPLRLALLAAALSVLPVSALTYGPELTSGMAAASGKALWKP